MSRVTLQEMLELAGRRVNYGVAINGSALICYAEAKRAIEKGMDATAKTLLVQSLEYSVGPDHPDSKLVNPVGQHTPLYGVERLTTRNHK